MNEKTSRRFPSYTAHMVRALVIAASTTLIIFLIFLSIGHFKLTGAGREILTAFIYCALIATPSIFVLTRISFVYTDRFPRLVVLMQAVAQFSTAVVGCLAAGLALQVLGLVSRGGYWEEFWSSAPFSVVISLMFGLSISSYETLRYKLQATALELRTRQLEQERACKLLAEARLSSLESRIRPHFLFNTLNSIAALIPSDPARAEDTVGKLASLLRFSLNAEQAGLTPLSHELKIVRDYLEIERTRFGERLRYSISMPEGLDSVRVPPLALQGLVENSVKHVVSERVKGASIEVIGTISGGQVRLEVIDDGPGFTLETMTPEHGLGNLAARLEILYGAAGQLAVVRADEKTVVRLSFPA